MKTQKILPFAAGTLLFSAALSPIATPRAAAQTAGFASQVVDYTPGTGIGAYTNSAAALGKPGGNVDGGTLNPFVPNYQTTELTGIGVGGQLTLALSNFVLVGPAGTREIGFFGNVGLTAVSNNPPTAQNPAAVFGLRSVLISVSADGVNYVPLNGGGLLTSTLPANYYTNPDTSNYNAAPPTNPTFADFGKPFAGTLADFNGETYAQTLTTLGGSAGGTWLDLSATGLSQVGYVRFSEPLTGGQNGGIFYLNGVSLNTTLFGTAVPEPSVVSMLIGAGVLVLGWVGRRRAARTAAALAVIGATLGGLAGSASAQMFDFTSIRNWTGSGANEAALVIDWHDGKNPTSLAWGYRFDGATTSFQMLQAIVAADPRLALFYITDPQYGPFIYGLGYDLNNNGGTFTPGTPGYDANDNSTETGYASDPGDHYAEGEFSKFWGLDLSTGSPYDSTGTWQEGPVGAGQQSVINGDWNGWSLSYDEQTFTIPDPGFPTAAAPAPEPSPQRLAVLALVVVACGVGVRRFRRGSTHGS